MKWFSGLDFPRAPRAPMSGNSRRCLFLRRRTTAPNDKIKIMAKSSRWNTIKISSSSSFDKISKLRRWCTHFGIRISSYVIAILWFRFPVDIGTKKKNYSTMSSTFSYTILAKFTRNFNTFYSARIATFCTSKMIFLDFSRFWESIFPIFLTAARLFWQVSEIKKISWFLYTTRHSMTFPNFATNGYHVRTFATCTSELRFR